MTVACHGILTTYHMCAPAVPCASSTAVHRLSTSLTHGVQKQ